MLKNERFHSYKTLIGEMNKKQILILNFKKDLSERNQVLAYCAVFTISF